ncbi:hypothetical protein [Herbaspirillum sp. SJZ099]|uniref:hypothetical protein n=1 Tax=Herbaspirillum sp. SJZ099 TaxID=2572916 RepID=UPI0011AA8F55|nr:hypothetical protein [Herbaspirillum sp. SJZ099]
MDNFPGFPQSMKKLSRPLSTGRAAFCGHLGADGEFSGIWHFLPFQARRERTFRGKWAYSKAFFERFAFSDNLNKYSRQQKSRQK